MSQARSHDYPDIGSHRNDGPAPELAPSEASQAVKGHNVRFVLTLGTVGAIVAIALAYLIFFGN